MNARSTAFSQWGGVFLPEAGEGVDGRRLFDLAFASIGLVLYVPFFLAVSAAIIVDDGVPVLFRQSRLGQGKQPIGLLKFRTMRDGRVTRVGAWLRGTGLDETAQFLNVVSGEMGMVGPRPLTQDDAVRLGWDRPVRAHRWVVRPGITGLAQVLAGRGEKHSRRLEDLYLRRRSLALDTMLIGFSFAMNLLGKRCVRAAIRRWRLL